MTSVNFRLNSKYFSTWWKKFDHLNGCRKLAIRTEITTPLEKPWSKKFMERTKKSLETESNPLGGHNLYSFFFFCKKKRTENAGFAKLIHLHLSWDWNTMFNISNLKHVPSSQISSGFKYEINQNKLKIEQDYIKINYIYFLNSILT